VRPLGGENKGDGRSRSISVLAAFGFKNSVQGDNPSYGKAGNSSVSSKLGELKEIVFSVEDSHENYLSEVCLCSTLQQGNSKCFT